MHTFVIAEAGSCHDRSPEKAKRLIEKAKEAGADAVKFQFWSDSVRLAARRNAPELARTYEDYRVPDNWLPLLKAYAQSHKIEFMCTVYLLNDVLIMNPFVERWKIASFEAADTAFIHRHTLHMKGKKEIIISLGMGQELHKMFQGNPEISTLYCVSSYPTESQHLNLFRMSAFHHDGLSDHTQSTQIGMLAVAAGARIIEKHLRLDDTKPENPDYKHALDPGLFKKYVSDIRWAEAVMGTIERKPVECEVKNMKYKVRP